MANDNELIRNHENTVEIGWLMILFDGTSNRESQLFKAYIIWLVVSHMFYFFPTVFPNVGWLTGSTTNQ